MDSAKSARDFMVTRTVTLHPDMHVLDAIGKLLKRRLTGAPVVDDRGHYLGVFSEKCCLRVLTATASQAASPALEPSLPTARDFMVTHPVTLPAGMDAFAAVEELLRKHHSGAIVVDGDGRYLGVFSQRTSMGLVVSAAYDQLPSIDLTACLENEPDRVTRPDDSLLTVAGKFLDHSWRLLPVLEEDNVIGQISRCDVLHAEHHLATSIRRRLEDSVENQAASEKPADAPELIVPPTVRSWMDCEARTITESHDLFSIAHIFRDTPYRRLPVVQDKKLVGLVTRRHVLQAACDSLKKKNPLHRSSQVFLSAVADPQDSSVMWD